MSGNGTVVLDNSAIETLQDTYAELVELWSAIDMDAVNDTGDVVLDRNAVERLSRLLSAFGLTRLKLERRRAAQVRRAEREGRW